MVLEPEGEKDSSNGILEADDADSGTGVDQDEEDECGAGVESMT